MDRVLGLSVDNHVQTHEALREVSRMPSRYVSDKVIDHLDDLAGRFIAASSLAILSSTRPDGIQDVTPRGDPPGFAKVLGEKLLAIPDRPGNHRMDTFENVLANPNVGILFIIPGHRDTLRVSGKAMVIQDEKIGQALAVNGRKAEYVLLVEVERVLSHCPKAFVRGKVWHPQDWPDTSDVPTLAEMMVAHGNLPDKIETLDEIIAQDGENRLY